MPKSRDFRLFIYDKYNFPTFWQIYYKNEFKTKNEAKEYLRTMMKQYLNIGQKKISKDDVNFSFLRCLLLIGWNTKNEIEYFNVGNLPDMISPFAVVMMGDALHNKNIVVKRMLNKLPISFWIKGLLHPWALFKYLLVKIGIHWNT